MDLLILGIIGDHFLAEANVTVSAPAAFSHK